MVYSGKDGFIVSCNCGCGSSFQFLPSDVLYVEALDSTFSTAQSKLKYRIKDKYDLLAKKLQKKPIYKNGVILDEEEFKDFVECLKKVSSELSDNVDSSELHNCEDKEKSAIHITKMVLEPNHILYAIDFRIRLNTKNLLCKEHWAYESYFTKAQIEKLIRNIEAKF